MSFVHGRGMDDNTLQSIFQPFYSNEGSKDTGPRLNQHSMREANLFYTCRWRTNVFLFLFTSSSDKVSGHSKKNVDYDKLRHNKQKKRPRIY